MRSTARRNTIAIALVAVALCADRTTLAASSNHHRADRTSFAGQIVRKLHVSLRRIVPAVDALRERPTLAAGATASRPAPVILAVVPARTPLSPFESRLPPPVC